MTVHVITGLQEMDSNLVFGTLLITRRTPEIKAVHKLSKTNNNLYS